MSISHLIVTVTALGVAVTATPTLAQTAGTSATLTSQQAPAVAGDDDESRTDVVDLIRMWRKKPPAPAAERTGPAWTIVPIFSSKPSTGVKFGAGADAEFKLGRNPVTRFSSVTQSLAYSTHKQLSASVNFRLYGAGNRWYIEGQNHYNGTASDNVMLGTNSIADQAPDVRYHSLQFLDTYYYRIVGDLYVGGGLYFLQQLHMEPFPEDSPDFATSPFGQYSAQHGFDLDTQTAAGPTVAVVFDDRDNQNDAVRGWYALASVRSYVAGFLGGDSSWTEIYTDARAYRAITADKRHRLAFWWLGNFVTSGAAPYLSLPTSGGDDFGRSARGYMEGRFRGEQLVYGEAEYRGLLTRNGFLGLAAFVNVTTVSNNTTGEQLFDRVAFGGGAGVRFLLHKQSRSNFGVDFAVGRDGSHGMYISLRDAF